MQATLDPKTITFTTRMGNFTFDKDILLSKAKLIRDSVVGQFFNPKPNEPRIRNEQDAHDYVRNHLGRDLEWIPFELSFAEQYAEKAKPVRVEYHDTFCEIKAFGGDICTCADKMFIG